MEKKNQIKENQLEVEIEIEHETQETEGGIENKKGKEKGKEKEKEKEIENETEQEEEQRIFISSCNTKELNYLFENNCDWESANWNYGSIIRCQSETKKILITGDSIQRINYHSEYNFMCLVWKKDEEYKDQLELYFTVPTHTGDYKQRNKKMRRISFVFQVKDIKCDENQFLVLTKKGKVYVLASHLKLSRLRYKKPNTESGSSKTFNLKQSKKFSRHVSNKSYNLPQVKKIACTSRSNYFLCHNGELFGNGINYSGELGHRAKQGENILPVLIYENVARVFSNLGGGNVFIITSDNKLYALGQNCAGKFGIGKEYTNKTFRKPVEINIKKYLNIEDARQIVDILALYRHSILITKNKGKIFSCGSGEYNGIGKSKSIFTSIPFFKNMKIKKIKGSYSITFVITSRNEMYGWGFDNYNHQLNKNRYKYTDSNAFSFGEGEGEGEGEGVETGKGKWILPRKINLPDYFQGLEFNLKNYTITCGNESFVFYHKYQTNSLIKDFEMLFKSKKYCDSELRAHNFCSSTNQKPKIISYPVHKLIVELRTGLTIEQIQKKFDKKIFDHKDMLYLLKWIYLGNNADDIFLNKKRKMQNLFKSLDLSFPPPKYSLKKDLLKLYNDEKSKDFYIVRKKKNKKIK
ncbi:regulator of chromosome condensation [Anaeramoeba flamelloides]|uniref:Regulator of chromosome condensation n=1 Tax=Anaeramoeba flamelloides TaxID=1746091 RepID=A0AAV7YVG0_9EUKA|nr:regulator of chromosome condensation [Anaeramoeba flamelloides]